MEGWVGMAGDTNSWRALELSVGMTSRAIQVGVAACQREVGTVVIKRGIIPVIGRMTGRAIRAKLPIMLIIVGGFIMLCILAMFLPMIRIVTSLGG